MTGLLMYYRELLRGSDAEAGSRLHRLNHRSRNRSRGLGTRERPESRRHRLLGIHRRGRPAEHAGRSHGGGGRRDGLALNAGVGLAVPGQLRVGQHPHVGHGGDLGEAQLGHAGDELRGHPPLKLVLPQLEVRAGGVVPPTGTPSTGDLRLDVLGPLLAEDDPQDGEAGLVDELGGAVGPEHGHVGSLLGARDVHLALVGRDLDEGVEGLAGAHGEGTGVGEGAPGREVDQGGFALGTVLLLAAIAVHEAGDDDLVPDEFALGIDVGGIEGGFHADASTDHRTEEHSDRTTAHKNYLHVVWAFSPD